MLENKDLLELKFKSFRNFIIIHTAEKMKLRINNKKLREILLKIIIW